MYHLTFWLLWLSICIPTCWSYCYTGNLSIVSNDIQEDLLTKAAKGLNISSFSHISNKLHGIYLSY